jgi:hypothetical protein
MAMWFETIGRVALNGRMAVWGGALFVCGAKV